MAYFCVAAVFLLFLYVGYRRFQMLGFAVFLLGGLMALGAVALAHFFIPDSLFPWVGFATLSVLLVIGAFVPRLPSSRRWQLVVLFLGALLIPLAILEWTALFLTDVLNVRFFSPLLVTGAAHEDWRKYHITVNTGVVADPELLWKPRPFPPYNRQHMRGEVVEIPKPKNVYRVMFYGDSNTDGPPAGFGWVEQLGQMVRTQNASKEKRVEIINAGVAGYSSYQGLKRFKSQVDEFQPDMIFVSFGWNDASPALGDSDKNYQSPNAVMSNLLKVLYRYRAYLLVREHLGSPVPVTHKGTSRVSPDEYVENLAEFHQEATAHGTKVVFLTRPYQMAQYEDSAMNSWRKNVPKYNDVLKQAADKYDWEMVDVHGLFAHHPQHFVDECHFTEQGHRRLAEELFTRYFKEDKSN